jgi:hypothetical protein
MSQLQLDALREKLLRAGIAPRHVRCYLGELRQHFDDLVRAETGNGLQGEAAFAAARARLGSDNDLAAAMLAQPELRSISARFPWAVFGIAPVVSLGLLIVVAVLVKSGLIGIAHGAGAPALGWIKSFVTVWDWSMMYAVPIIVAAVFYGIGARQLMATRWLVCGALLVAVVGTAVTCSTIVSNLPHKSAISVGLGFNSGTDLPRLAANIVLVCAMSTFYWLWQRTAVAE